MNKYFNLSFNDRKLPYYTRRKIITFCFRFAIPRRRENSRRVTHRAEETGATWKTRRPATSKRAGSKVKTIAYNWHMKFKGGVTRRTGGKAGGSLNTPAVFEPLFFSRPSASLEIYISSLLSVYPASFKEPLVAILPLPYPRIPVNLPFVPTPFDTAPRGTRSTSFCATQRQSSIYGADYASLADNRKYAIE